jgi:hypothetical protein
MSGTEGRLPDFLVIGAPKAGTTALYRALERHPEVFMTQPKEPTFFSYAGTPPRFAGPGGANYSKMFEHDEQRYRQMFASFPPHAVVGEASVLYLTCERAPEVAARYVPDARLIAILRHPVERAYSQFLHVRQEGNEPHIDFETAWNEDARRWEEGWVPGASYQRTGFFGRGLERWLQHFPRERLLVLFYEDWCERPAEVLAAAWRHLGVEPLADPLVTRDNVSSLQPRWPWLHQQMIADSGLRRWAQNVLPLAVRDAITRPLRGMNLAPGPRLDPALRTKLALTYHDDLTRVEAITGRDLTAWRR